METPKPRRVVITPDGLVAALQGKLRQAAEKAAQAAVAKQVDDAVSQALDKIDEVRRSSVREIEELFPARIQSLKLPRRTIWPPKSPPIGKSRWRFTGAAEELAQRLEGAGGGPAPRAGEIPGIVDKMSREIEPQIHAKMNEAVSRATHEFEGATARAVERRYEQMLAGTHAVTQEALLKLDARSAEVQALVQSAVNAPWVRSNGNPRCK